jgi:hypothetical protein
MPFVDDDYADLINRLIIDWTFKLRIWLFRFGSIDEHDQVIFE